MISSKKIGIVGLACLASASCNFKHAEPSGQVVAVVDGQEITTRELGAELAGNQISDPAARKRVEQAALQNIILSKVLAKAARDQGIDKDADFELTRERAIDGLLAQALEAKLVKSVPPPAREEGEHFVADHPDTFAQRRIFDVDQIHATPTGKAQELLNELRSVNTMDQAEALLQRDKVEYKRGLAQLDALSMDPDLTPRLLKLPPNEVVVLPDPNGVSIIQIMDSKLVPLSGDAAVNAALQLISARHIELAVKNQVSDLMSRAAIHYNAAYAPPAPAVAPGASNAADGD